MVSAAMASSRAFENRHFRRRVSHFPAGVALDLRNELVRYIDGLVALAMAQMEHLLKPLLGFELGRLEAARQDASVREAQTILTSLYQQLLELMPEARAREIALRAVNQTMIRASEQLRRELAQVRLPQAIGGFGGVEFLLPPGRMHEIAEARVAEIVRLIKTIPDHFSENLERLVLEAVSQGKGYRALAQEIREMAEVTRKRAKTIAVDQINRSYSSIARDRMENLGVKTVVWLTAEDERTCPQCAPLHGRRFSLEELSHRGEPPLHPVCRCTLIADVLDLRRIAGLSR